MSFIDWYIVGATVWGFMFGAYVWPRVRVWAEAS